MVRNMKIKSQIQPYHEDKDVFLIFENKRK